MIKAGNRAVIFDLDGTLLDTSPGSIDSVNYTIKNLGLKSLGSEELYSFVGPPIQESFRNHFNMDETAALNAAGLFRGYYKEHSLFEPPRVHRRLFYVSPAATGRLCGSV